MKLLCNIIIVIILLLVIESCKRFLNFKDKKSPKKILIISTGGTFNMVESEDGLKPEFNETYLREKIKPVTEGCELTFYLI